MERYDGVIVGGGLAGLQCARLLTRRGFSVLLVDRKKSLDTSIRFASRLWMRRVISSVQQPSLLELACAGMRLPILKPLAWHVFFGRGSFPNVELQLMTQPAA